MLARISPARNWPPAWTAWPKRFWESRHREPPVDAFAVARALGIAVALDDRQAGPGAIRPAERSPCGATAGDDPLAARTAAERQQWAVAHEIGEHVACHVFAQWGVDPRETAAQRPRGGGQQPGGPAAVADGLVRGRRGRRAAGTCSLLKARYATASHELIARRMLECRPPVIISIFDHSAFPFGGATFPAGCRRHRRPKCECWRDVHAATMPLQNCARPRSHSGLASPRGRMEAGDTAHARWTSGRWIVCD